MKRTYTALFSSCWLALAACGAPATPKEDPASLPGAPNPAALLPTGTPRVVAPGLLTPLGGEINVASEGPGLLREVLVKEGDAVQAGQVLVRFDDAVERARVATAEARVKAAEASKSRTARGNRPEERGEAEASAEAASARASLAREAYERELSLFQKGASTQDAVDRAKRQAEAEEAQARSISSRAALVKKGSRVEDRALAGAELEGALAQLEEAKAALARKEVRAPKAGTILEVAFDAGEYYAPSAGPLLILGDMSRAEAVLEVDELDAPRVALGQRVILSADGFVEPIAEGKIVKIAPRMGQKTLSTDRAQERQDTRVREVTVELPALSVVSGLRVWGTIEAQKQVAQAR